MHFIIIFAYHIFLVVIMLITICNHHPHHLDNWDSCGKTALIQHFQTFFTALLVESTKKQL